MGYNKEITGTFYCRTNKEECIMVARKLTPKQAKYFSPKPKKAAGVPKAGKSTTAGMMNMGMMKAGKSKAAVIGKPSWPTKGKKGG